MRVSFDEPFYPDPRGGKIASYKIVRDAHIPAGGQVLLMCGASAAFAQLKHAAMDISNEAQLTDIGKKKWTHALRFPGEVPSDIITLVNFLQNALSIPSPDFVDHMVALDWYSQPDGDSVAHTRAGNFVYYTKYATFPEYSNSRRARSEMIREMTEAIRVHRLMRNASAITAAPGHLADGNSFGEILAREVAGRIGMRYVEATANGGPRESQKLIKQDLLEAFDLDDAVYDTVLVIDDVYHSGGTASGIAAAAKRAGAHVVICLCVARTLSR
jgi:adenine/guanine phosphoribosyltransferase-like PRPP-binding protein